MGKSEDLPTASQKLAFGNKSAVVICSWAIYLPFICVGDTQLCCWALDISLLSFAPSATPCKICLSIPSISKLNASNFVSWDAWNSISKIQHPHKPFKITSLQMQFFSSNTGFRGRLPFLDEGPMPPKRRFYGMDCPWTTLCSGWQILTTSLLLVCKKYFSLKVGMPHF